MATPVLSDKITNKYNKHTQTKKMSEAKITSFPNFSSSPSVVKRYTEDSLY